VSNNLLLERLIEPDTPVRIKFFPETIGWKVLAVVLLLALIYWAVTSAIKFRANGYRRSAVKKLRKIMAEEVAATRQLMEINRLLKVAAVHAFPDKAVEPLYGEAWLKFLDSTCPKSRFLSAEARQWQVGLFEQWHLNAIALNPILTNVEHNARCWIQHHKREAK